ncbi:MAG: hypothetical protein VR69_15240 [Peptococcaceae bacterium BRH_c4b]|nr:MAG: hypothetical protein VR69_15240 [Peptococcaceae bacterium BRH_c4b]
MVNTIASKDERIVGQGRTQLLCETRFSVKPAMSRVLGELYDVEITDYTTFIDKVLVKGIVEKSFFYKHPHLGKRDGNKNDGKKDDGKKDDEKREAGKRDDGKRDDGKSDDGKSRDGKKDEYKKGDSNKADEKKDDRVKDVSNEFIKWLFQLNLGQSASSDVNKQESRQEGKNVRLKNRWLNDNLTYNGLNDNLTYNRLNDNLTNSRLNDNLKYSGFTEGIKEDGEKYMTGWCARLDEHDGIVHFYQETLEFAGVMEIPGVMPGDICHVESAEVRNYDSVKATEMSDDGLVNAGRQIFLIEVALKVTRKENKSTIEKQDDFEKSILNVKPILVSSWVES